MSLTFIDHVEKKIQSPDREKIGVFGSKKSDLKSSTKSEVQEKDNEENKIISKEENTTADKSIDRMEYKIGFDLSNVKPRSRESKDVSVGDTSDEGDTSMCNDSFTYEYKLNESDIQMLKSQTDIGSENKVTVEHIADGSCVVQEKSAKFRDDDQQTKRQIDTLVTSDRKEDSLNVEKRSERTFEFTSHTSNMLLFEKSKQKESTGRKRKELSPLTIDDDAADNDVEDGNAEQDSSQPIKESVPQQCSEDLAAAESRTTQKEAPLSPTTFTKDPDQHVILEEDEENVIIHLDTDFDQKDAVASKEASNSKEQLKKESVQSLQIEKSAEILSSANPIEVERKFTVTADTKIRLLEMGAELKKERTFEDMYYDNADYRLTLSDCWLRQRNGQWEFKVAVSSFQTKSSSTQYSEVTDEKEISRLLIRYLRADESMRNLSLEELIQKLNLSIFAKFSTTRQTYYLPECTIDLDLADFGFQVGEIEVMVADEKRIAEALRTIDGIAKKLGRYNK